MKLISEDLLKDACLLILANKQVNYLNFLSFRDLPLMVHCNSLFFLFNSTFILTGCCRLCNNRRNHRIIFSLQIMLRTILAYPSLWCYEWNRFVGWVRLVIKTTGCSRSTLWISERWIDLIRKTLKIKMQFKKKSLCIQMLIFE